MLNDIMQSFINVPVLAFYLPKQIALPEGFKQSKVFMHGQESQAFDYFRAGIAKASDDIKQIFNELDANHNGFLEKDEIAGVVEKLGI
mmetsp:Transcript_17608/g.24304  ORF Transcript_17608/g.24304 Transcript_17608/m.24304 type:complete len:88 (-) Transcript_17608:1280-1543(-)